MRLERHAFARLLASVTKAVPSRNTIPVLSTVRLVATNGTLTVTATDLDLEISGSIPAEGDIAACIDAKLLAAAVNKAAGSEIEIDLDGQQAILKSGRSRYKLDTLPVGDFPNMNAGTFTATFEADLAALFAPVQFAISSEETRFYLNGIFLEPDAATATDGHRLSHTKFDTLADFKPVIVPRFLVPLVPKGKCSVSIGETKIRLRGDDVVVTSKLVDGTFPDYRRVIPSARDNVVVVDAGALKAAAERVAIISQERETGILFEIANNEITVTARGSGEALDVVPCELDGEARVGLNANYIAEILGAFPAGAVRMSVADGMSPVVIESDQAEKQLAVLMPRWVAVLMPRRV